MNVVKVILFACLVMMPYQSLAQNLVQNSCLDDPRFNQFDFWLGAWRVTDVNGVHVGDNRIEKTEAGCLITENWINVQGQTGFSMNYFNPMTEQWRQIWVSAPGVEIDYVGGLNESGAMQLEGTITYFGAGTSAPFRGTWTQNDNGTVRQLFEQFDDNSGEWQVWFDGLYTRVSPE